MPYRTMEVTFLNISGANGDKKGRSLTLEMPAGLRRVFRHHTGTIRHLT
jgi:hypothetical protein